MDRLAKLFKDYVAQNPPACGDAQAVADQLYWAFMENHRIDDNKTNDLYATLQKRVKLPLREYDEVLCVVSDICTLHGRMAFMEGLKVGLVLLHELAP